MDDLQEHLRTRILGRTLRYEYLVSSTQTIAHEWATQGAPEGAVVIAEGQKAGRGRSGKQWNSPIGTGIWMSLIFRPPIPIRDATHFTLLSSIAVQKGIQAITALPVQIKWPNDLLIHGKKVCGILTEVRSCSNQMLYMIIGIGVNVNTVREDFQEELTATATSLRIETGQELSRLKLTAAILQMIEEYYLEYLQQGFVCIKKDWENNCGILGKEITANTAHGRVTGKALHLTGQGELVIQTKQGECAINSPYIELS